MYNRHILAGIFNNGVSHVCLKAGKLVGYAPHHDPSNEAQWNTYISRVKHDDGVLVVSTGRELWRHNNHIDVRARNTITTALQNGLNSSRIIVLYNACSSRLHIPEFSKAIKATVRFHPIRHFEVDTYIRHTLSGIDVHSVGSPFLWKDKHPTGQVEEEEYKYLALMGKPGKIHRAVIIDEMYKRGMLRDSITGVLINREGIESLAQLLSSTYSRERVYEVFGDIIGSPDNVVFERPTCAITSNYVGFPYDTSLYGRTRVSIVAESEIGENYNGFLSDGGYYITEKTTRTIWNKHPFVAVGSPYFLSGLRNVGGYATFGGIVNEGYDDMTSVFDRAERATECAEELYRNLDNPMVREIVEHNKNNLIRVSIKEISKLMDIYREQLQR